VHLRRVLSPQARPSVQCTLRPGPKGPGSRAFLTPAVPVPPNALPKPLRSAFTRICSPSRLRFTSLGEVN
jgi:hypothetical protein